MKLFFVLIFLASQGAHAEYRVYRLRLTDTKSQKSREILSTLMPQQYVFYYPITPYETLQIVDHWMCWGRSDGFKKYCTRPFSDIKSPKAGSTAVLPSNS